METKVFIVTLVGDVTPHDLSSTAWGKLPIDTINVTEVVGAKNVEIISQQIQIKN